MQNEENQPKPKLGIPFMSDLTKYVDGVLELIRACGVWGGMGILLLVVGTFFVFIQFKQAKPSPPSPKPRPELKKLERQIIDVFGDISLMERNEEGRNKVAGAIAICKFLDVPFDPKKYNLGNFLNDLMEIMALKKEDKTGVFRTRENLVQVCSSAQFEPAYLSNYVSALIGMTHFVEGQSVQNCNTAYPFINNAVESLEKSHTNELAESIVNARGICHAIQMRSDQRPEVRIREALGAHRDFVAAVRLRRNSRTNPGAIVLYRFFNNHAEWCVDVVYLWSSLDASLKQVLSEEIYRCMEETEKESRKLFGTQVFDLSLGKQEACIKILLASATAASERALSSANTPEVGRRRPVIHFTTVLVGTACEFASQQYGEIVLSGVPVSFREHISDDGKRFHLGEAVKLWSEEMDSEAIIGALQENPVMKDWLPKTRLNKIFAAQIEQLKKKNSK